MHALDSGSDLAHFLARRRALQNCAHGAPGPLLLPTIRKSQRAISRRGQQIRVVVDVTRMRVAGRRPLAAPAVRLRPNNSNSVMTAEGEHVSVNGKVKFFNETKGYGFFTRDDGSGDVFVHRTDLPANIGLLYEGQAVSFDIERTQRGLRAVNIALA